MSKRFHIDAAQGYLLRNGDQMYGAKVRRCIASLGINEVVSARALPWQNAYVERAIGTLRRELLGHVVLLNERHLKQLNAFCLDYCHLWRTH